MEEENKQRGSNNKKKINPLSSLISVGGKGGGGIAGLVVFGGALAVAGYVVVTSFARNNKNKAKKGGRGTHDQQPKSQQILLDECGCKGQEDHALHSLLQQSKSQDVDAACCWTSDNTNKGTNQEEKTDTKQNSEEESLSFAFSDHSQPESAASSNENGVAEDCVALSFNSPNGQAQELDLYEPQDNSVALSFNSPNGQAQELNLYEPQDNQKSIETESEGSDIIDDDNDDDGVLGSGEEDSSKATGCTSLDFNEEPVWPAELMIQEPEPEFKQGYCDNNHVWSDCDADGSDYAENDKAMKATNKSTLKQKGNFSLLLRDRSSALRTMVIPTLLLALLLFLVLLTRQESFHALDEGSAVIVP